MLHSYMRFVVLDDPGIMLSRQQIDILQVIMSLGHQRLNGAVSAAEIAEVLSGRDPSDIRQHYTAIQGELQALAGMGMIEHYHTLHEWRLTPAGDLLCLQIESS